MYEIKKISVLVFCSVLALFLNATYGSSGTSANITAVAYAVCPFEATLSALPGYALLGNITLNYSIKTTSSCTLGNAAGYLAIYGEKNHTLIYNKTLVHGEITNSTSLSSIEINTSILTNSTYLFVLSFSSANYTNSSRAVVEMFRPENLTLRSFSSQNVSEYSGETFFVSTENTGGFASQNAELVINITGPVNYALNYTLQPLYPGQFSNESIFVSYITGVAGRYVAKANLYYFVNGIKRSSGPLNTTYYVFAPPSKHIAKPTVASTPSAYVVSFPYLTVAPTGTSQPEYIKLENTANMSEVLTLSVPDEYKNIISIAEKNITIPAKSNATIPLLLIAPSNLSGSFTIPINITSKIGNYNYSLTDYLVYVISNASLNGAALMQVTLFNSTKDAEGTIEFKNLMNYNITNLVFELEFPEFVTNNIENIKAYGLSNVSIANGIYTIRWLISNLAKGQTTDLYYSISNISNPSFLTSFQTIARVLSPTTPSSIIKILNASVPILNSNSTSNITIELLYTGIAPQKIFIGFNAPPEFYLPKPNLYVNATPNEFIREKFPIFTSSRVGSFVAGVFVSTKGANESFSLPILVLPQSGKATTTTLQTTTIEAVSRQEVYESTLSTLVLILIIAIGISAYAVKKAYNRPVYSHERLMQMLRIKERIKKNPRNQIRHARKDG
ncbi:MAG: hypothetical protein QXL16_00755 [Candidatus Micrarchaeaceae archaeon]